MTPRQRGSQERELDMLRLLAQDQSNPKIG
jgi:hypothetical protein